MKKLLIGPLFLLQSLQEISVLNRGHQYTKFRKKKDFRVLKCPKQLIEIILISFNRHMFILLKLQIFDVVLLRIIWVEELEKRDVNQGTDRFWSNDQQ